MSLQAYLDSSDVSADTSDFYAVLMAAFRLADSENQSKLQSVFPEVWSELVQRYGAPSGLLEGESCYVNGIWSKLENGKLAQSASE